MEAKIDLSKPYYSLPIEKIVVENIMKEDILSGETNAKYYNVEDEVDEDHKEGVATEITPSITQFLKLPQKQGQGTRILHEPFVDYSFNQVLTSDDHIQNMQQITHTKNMVAIERKKRAKQMYLTKKKRAATKVLKEAIRSKKTQDKEKREATLKKWKKDDNGGQRKKNP